MNCEAFQQGERKYADNEHDTDPLKFVSTNSVTMSGIAYKAGQMKADHRQLKGSLQSRIRTLHHINTKIKKCTYKGSPKMYFI